MQKNKQEKQIYINESLEDMPSKDFVTTEYEQIGLEDEFKGQINPSNYIKKEIETAKDKSISAEEKEKFEEAQETVKKQNSKKKKWLSLIFLLVNIGVVAGILTFQLLGEGSAVAPFEQFSQSINWWIFILVIVTFALIMFLETAKIWILCYRTTKKSRPALCYKVAAIGRYYDDITPLAAGGQPFQVYYLNKRGVPASDALSIPMGKYVIWQLAYVIFTLIVMIFSISLTSTANGAGATVVTAGSWLGFALNSALVLFVGLLSISKTVGTKMMSGILKLLHKMKIVKNYDKQYDKVMKLVNDYQATMKKYAKDKWAFLSVFVLTLVGFVLHYALPFLIYASFYGFEMALPQFSTVFTYCVMVDLAASFFPLPGGTGAAELSFTALFGLLFAADGMLFWAMIIWRVFTYYIYIVQGLILIIYDYARGNKKHEWEEKKWLLEAESRTFEDNHLKDFELSLQKNNKKEKRRKI